VLWQARDATEPIKGSAACGRTRVSAPRAAPDLYFEIQKCEAAAHTEPLAPRVFFAQGRWKNGSREGKVLHKHMKSFAFENNDLANAQTRRALLWAASRSSAQIKIVQSNHNSDTVDASTRRT
jgi:hypothetical protein